MLVFLGLLSRFFMIIHNAPSSPLALLQKLRFSRRVKTLRSISVFVTVSKSFVRLDASIHLPWTFIPFIIKKSPVPTTNSAGTGSIYSFLRCHPAWWIFFILSCIQSYALFVHGEISSVAPTKLLPFGLPSKVHSLIYFLLQSHHLQFSVWKGVSATTLSHRFKTLPY